MLTFIIQWPIKSRVYIIMNPWLNYMHIFKDVQNLEMGTSHQKNK